MNTGAHSINSRIHGQIRALVEQAKDKSYDFYDTKRLMKALAVIDGYPTVTKRIKYRGRVRRVTEPASLAGQPDSVALILCTAIQVFADERNLYLWEYISDDSEELYKSVGGRSYIEMQQYIAALRSAGHEAEARELEKKPRWRKGETW